MNGMGRGGQGTAERGASRRCPDKAGTAADDQPNPEYDARPTVEGAMARIGREQYPPGSPGIER